MIILLKLFITIYADRMAHEEFSRAIRSYFTHTLHLSIGYHTDTNSGKLTKELMRGSDNIFYILLEMFRKLLPAIVTILLMIPILLFLDWRMG